VCVCCPRLSAPPAVSSNKAMVMASSAPSKRGSSDLLRRNPMGCIVILIGGLLVAVCHVPNPLVVSNLAATVWGRDMAKHMSLVDMARFVIAFFCTGPLGRIGDKHGSKVVAAFVAVIETLPPLMLLIFGETSLGLTAWSLARVATGITGTTLTVAPALFALLHDAVASEDYDAFVGLAFAGATCMWMANLLVAAFLRKSNDSSTAVLVYVVGLSVVMLGLIAAIRVPRREAKSKCCTESGNSGQSPSDQASGQGTSDSGSQCQDGMGDCSKPSSRRSEDGRGVSKCSWLASLQFAFSSSALTKLCAIASLVSIPETVLTELMNQFSYENLDLMGTAASGKERSFVTFYNALALQVSLMLGSYVVGLLAPRLTSLRLLRWLIPASAVLQSLPAVVRLVPERWTVVLSAVAVGLSILVLPPLQALVPQLAPEGRVGEALGTVGSFKCIASLMGNSIVSIGAVVIQSTGLEKPLWIFFPLCGLISLCGLPIALRLPTPPAAEAEAGEASNPTEPASGAEGAQLWSRPCLEKHHL